MVEYVDKCSGCPTEMGCLGEDCPQRHVKVRICDKCGDTCRELNELDSNWQICDNCLLTEFPKI